MQYLTTKNDAGMDVSLVSLQYCHTSHTQVYFQEKRRSFTYSGVEVNFIPKEEWLQCIGPSDKTHNQKYTLQAQEKLLKNFLLDLQS